MGGGGCSASGRGVGRGNGHRTLNGSLAFSRNVAVLLRSDPPPVCRLVHRLDKDASGCLVIARTVDSAAWLSQAFAQHSSAALNPAVAHTGRALIPSQLSD